ncbi:hypothetical protein DPMN_059884 [Dreissena polymorpha]|uniref:Uncharacterized protein n=1 Tax=Dreissena polymorpha TaxID=45954 RepID=A0A9D4C4R8_DREPO|nr:hypothetical protein DPMN_059884 [Dreissena polymorpha]
MLSSLFPGTKNQYLVPLGEIEGTLQVGIEPVTSRSLDRPHIHVATETLDRLIQVIYM